jgi:hypothetical protein
MARIRKQDHARILHMVEVEYRKPSDVATELGCSTAAVLALVIRSRREAEREREAEADAQPPLALDAVPPPGPQEEKAPIVSPGVPALEADASADVPVTDTPEVADTSDQGRNVVAFEPVPSVPKDEADNHRSLVPSRTPPMQRSGSSQRRGSSGGQVAVGARLAKPGYGLMMRTADGEENLTPFRSMDDLLSAIKPILRASANSPEPVWFSLQPVDLTTIDVEAA